MRKEMLVRGVVQEQPAGPFGRQGRGFWSLPPGQTFPGLWPARE